jgi:hypothetical protein
MASPRGEVVGTDYNGAFLDLAPPSHVVSRSEVNDVSVIIVGGETGCTANLTKGASIEEEIDSFSAGQLAPASLSKDAWIC